MLELETTKKYRKDRKLMKKQETEPARKKIF